MSSELNAALDQLEAEVFRQARQQLEPDQAHIESLWRGLATTALGAAFSGVSTSVAPASGTGWATPRPVTTAPSAAPASTQVPAAAPTEPVPAPAMESASGLVQQPGLLQRLGHASFGLRALLGAAVGGAILGFAVGRGSTGYGDASGGRALQPGAATMSSTDRSQANRLSDDKVSHPARVAATDAFDASAGVALGSLPADEPQAPMIARGNGPKPEEGRSAPPSSSEQAAEAAKPSFYEELEYLKRAQSALRQGNGALALGLMTSLDSIQPGGALLSERGVAKVLAHCQLGDVESAMRVAERLAESDMASVYTERLESSCAGAVFSKP